MATKQAWASGLFVAGVVIAMTAIIAAATKYPDHGLPRGSLGSWLLRSVFWSARAHFW